MHPDTSSHQSSGDDPSADSRVEEILRALPVPALPAHWRGEVLRAVRQPVWPWLNRPVRWGLAASWAAIGVLHLTMPAGPDPLPAGVKLSPPSPPLTLDPEAQWLAGLDPQPEELLSP